MQYEIHGQKTDDFPFTAVIDEAKPVFTTMPGWGCDISGVRKWEDLPEDFTCELCGVGKDEFSPEE